MKKSTPSSTVRSHFSFSCKGGQRQSRASRVFATATIIAALFAAHTALAADNLLTNGSFEQPVVTSPHQNYTGYYSFTGWSGYSTGSGTNACGIVSGTDNGLTPYDGIQSFSFNGDNPPAGTYIEQTFATIPGQAYEVNFALGRNGAGTLVLSLDAQIFDSNSVQLALQHYSSPSSDIFQLTSFSFYADSYTTRLRFTDTSPSNSGNDIFIDGVSVTALPEPASLAVLGIPALGLLLRRRRTQSK
jgi:hypothetical protein